MNDNNNFFIKNIGAIIGVIIGLILACTGLYKIILILVAIVGGGYVGYYIQYNKESVKEKTIKFINKL
jgi:uncharacterized membrane protein